MATHAQISAALPYGFGVYYAIMIEGVPLLCVEREPRPAAWTVAGYTVDAALMIDESARVGSRIDENTGIGRAFDLTFGLERTPATVDLFSKPANISRLTGDLAFDEVGTVVVDSTAGFAAAGVIHVGNERIEYAATTATEFQTLTRGTPGAGGSVARSVPADSQIATWITDGPLFWRGRRVSLLAVPVDPYGRLVSTAVADYPEIWRGHVAAEPQPYPGGWALSCRPLDRRVDEKIAAAFSGTATLMSDPDPLVRINPDMGILFNAISGWTASQRPDPVFFHPFSALSAGTFYRLSELKLAISDAWIAKITAEGVPTAGFFPAEEVKWIPAGPFDACDQTSKILPPSGNAAWQPWEMEQLHVRARRIFPIPPAVAPDIVWGVTLTGNILGGGSSVAFAWSEWNVLAQGAGWGPFDPGTINITQADALDYVNGSPPDGGFHWFPMPLLALRGNQLGVLRIVLDDEDPAMVPPAGFVVLEGNDQIFVIEYDSKAVEGSEITLSTSNMNVRVDDIMGAIGDGQGGTIAVKFAFIDSGQVVDTMRRLLFSSGRGDNDATYDTLAAGYDLTEVNAASFDLLDGGWSDLDADFLIDESVSFASIYGPLLAISQRAIVPRNDGAGMRLACVSTSVVETAAYTFELTDEHIIASEAGGSVRAVADVETPNRIEVALMRYLKSEGRIIINDIASQRSDGLHAASFSINGFNRDECAPAILGWARSLFAARGGRLVYEIHCVPWVDCQAGDAIRIRSRHFNLWTRATGARGYTGTARVLGRQVDLKTQRTVLHVAIAGAFQTFSLCPAAVIVSADVAAAPTLITLSGDYYALCAAYIAAEPAGFRMLLYNPGTDETGDFVTVSSVSGSAETSALLVISGFSLTSPITNGATCLTIPFSADDSAVQAYHMHTDTQGASWQ